MSELGEHGLVCARRDAVEVSDEDRWMGRGVRRDVLVDLAAAGLAMTVHAETTPVVAVVRPTPGRAAAFSALSPREREVTALFAACHTIAEIASGLVIAIGTVKDRVHSILEKSGLRTRAAVAAAWHGHASSA